MSEPIDQQHSAITPAPGRREHAIDIGSVSRPVNGFCWLT